MEESKKALDYHANPVPGKLAIVPTKPCETSYDLSLAYSPGVAEPCREIANNIDDAYRYTAKGNLVAVITNGTAVLGLGDIGPTAAKPVMEGKAVLFKVFADLDVFDLELDSASTDDFIQTVKSLAPTFGGINLEDIRAPECFRIERELQEALDIPVFHDDQHGTAIIVSAALLNALDILGKDIRTLRVVISGAGAAAVASARLLTTMGVSKEYLTMCDSKGVIYRGRKDRMNEYKEEFALETSARSLAEALQGADMFLGLSVKGALTPEMLTSMAKDPIVFALANPDPEIEFEVARTVRPDAIVGTGRSDYPNQVNNVLGFPFIFRGALDVRARGINEEMKIAAVQALANLAKEPPPESVRKAYGNISFSFGRDYLIPKPFDPRVLYYVAPAVAKAAIESGMSREPLDIDEYSLRLKAKQNFGRVMLRGYHGLARRRGRKRIALPEGNNAKVIKAAIMAYEEGIAQPILLGKISAIQDEAKRLDVDISAMELVEPIFDERYENYVEKYYELRARRGVTRIDAKRSLRKAHYFAHMMLADGVVDGVICGIDRYYPSAVRPILEIVGLKEGVTTAAAMYLMSIQERLFFLADTAINIEMDSEKLANTAILASEFAQSMDVEPRVAMLSFSNFGSVDHPLARVVRKAKELVQARAPELAIDGEMQADTAVVGEILKESYPFTSLSGAANVLVFPDMQSGNIAFKLLQRLGGARVVGPIILGLNAPAHVMQRHASVDEIFNMITVAAAQAVLGD